MMSAKLKVLSAADILGRVLGSVDVEVPELGGVVRLREMTALEGKDFAATPNDRMGTCQLIQLTAVDENGNKLFTLEQVQDLEKLGAGLILRLARAARKINGLDLVSAEKEAAAAKNA